MATGEQAQGRDPVFLRLLAGECYLTSDNRTSINGCEQYVFWHLGRGFHVLWNLERDRPQRLYTYDEAGLEALLRLGFGVGVPEGVAGDRTALPEKVVAGSIAHAAARERIVADLRRDRTTWLALPQHEARGDHLWLSPSGAWLTLGSKGRTILGMDDAIALEDIDGALMRRPESGATPADAALVAAALEVDAAVQNAERGLADGLMLVYSRGGLTHAFIREGERSYHVAIREGRGLTGSFRPIHRCELFEGVQGGVLQPVPPAAREDVRAFLEEGPFAWRP